MLTASSAAATYQQAVADRSTAQLNLDRIVLRAGQWVVTNLTLQWVRLAQRIPVRIHMMMYPRVCWSARARRHRRLGIVHQHQVGVAMRCCRQCLARTLSEDAHRNTGLLGEFGQDVREETRIIDRGRRGERDNLKRAYPRMRRAGTGSRD